MSCSEKLIGSNKERGGKCVCVCVLEGEKIMLNKAQQVKNPPTMQEAQEEGV